MLLQEFDIEKKAILNPDELENRIDNFPKIGVSCFSKKLVDKYVELYNPKQIAEISNANGRTPVYEIQYKGTRIALFMSRVGAPACTVSYEEISVMGVDTLILFGTCGVLDKNIDDCSIIIPISALRDEGTSYHYADVEEEITVNEKYIDLFEQVLEEHNYTHTKGKVWTTDAPYRETHSKMMKRKNQGCICVDMECSAMSAVSKFRNKEFFQFFYAADNLDCTNWDMRSLGNDANLSEKEKIVLLAFELANKIDNLGSKVCKFI